MNKRTAKRWACSRVALTIESLIDHGIEWFEGEDQIRAENALVELQENLRSRGLTRQDGKILYGLEDKYNPPAMNKHLTTTDGDCIDLCPLCDEIDRDLERGILPKICPECGANFPSRLLKCQCDE